MQNLPEFWSPLRAREFLESITRGKVASGRQKILAVATAQGFRYEPTANHPSQN